MVKEYVSLSSALCLRREVLERLWARDRCLASKGVTHVGCSLPIYQVAILQERHRRRLCLRWPQSDDLEGTVAIANDPQQGLRVSRVGITSDGDLSRLREGIR